MYTTRDLIADVWLYVKADKWRFWLATTCRALSDIAWLYPPYAFAVIVNFFSNYKPEKPLTPLYIAFSLTILAIVLRYAGIYIGKTLMYRISEKAALRAQQKSIEHLILLDMSWHEQESAGSKFKRIERGSSSLDRMLRIWINNFIEITINLIGVIFIITKFDFVIGATTTVFLLTYYTMSRFSRKKVIAVASLLSEKEERRSGILFESISNIRSVKIMSMAQQILSKLSVSGADLFETIKKRIFWYQGGNSARNFYAQIFRISVMIFIVYGITEGVYELGFLVLFAGYFGSVVQSMGELADVSEDFAVAKNSFSRMQSIFQTPITIDSEDGKVAFPSNWQTISIKNVSFSYHDKLILDDVSLEIRRGEKIGIVGLSGAGKSTLFKLLLKEHESYTGHIYFDDVPLKNISKKDYFNHVAVVLQDIELFDTTLRENITITNTEQSENAELLASAINVAHVRDFMNKLPQGVKSIVGEKGVKLSGGEKQRVGVARAIFKNPQILLMDEATSHLDVESEEKIKDSLHKFFQSVTAVVIAHRLTTVKEMDKIIVIEGGKIIESGNFADLHQKKGRFFELWEKQKL
ncbi:MAG: ABC transporter ATP-binding protein [Patescibacteria group bacterium]